MEKVRVRGQKREIRNAPVDIPVLNMDQLEKLNDWQNKVFKKPILDDLSGYYDFAPNRFGVEDYTQKPRKRQFAGKIAIGKENVENLVGSYSRQPKHIAKSAELATGIFYRLAEYRFGVIYSILEGVENGNKPKEDILTYASDAIIDYGYCLSNPKNVPIERINNFGQNLGNNLQDFGSYSLNNKHELFEDNGIAILGLVLEEQHRRIGYWEPKYRSLIECYGQQVNDEKINEGLLSVSMIPTQVS